MYPEFDNLYLDLNGVIHNCSRSNDEGALRAPIPDHVLFPTIFEYIEMLFSNVKPKKVFFVAIDGVAPRAKMNQQRARRFTSGLESERLLAKSTSEGLIAGKEDIFDGNCITPGTVFMEKLTRYLKYFFARKVNEDRAWQNVKVILSGHEVPGEGEHKIMEYIRLAKAQPDYDPNTRHCFYGQDADLIVLGLVTHEPHLSILREEIVYEQRKTSAEAPPPRKVAPRFLLFHISLLRDYLQLDFQDVQREVRFPFSLDRVIDDFILITMLLGNDFVPHLPDLHISKQGMLYLFAAYKTVLPTLPGYLTENGIINLHNFEAFLNGLRIYDFIADKERIAQHPLFRNPKHATKHYPAHITPQQCAILDLIYRFVTQRKEQRVYFTEIDPANRTFIKEAGLNLGLRVGVDAHAANRPITLQLPFGSREPPTEASFNDNMVQVFVKYQALLEDAKATVIKHVEPDYKANKQYYKSKLNWEYAPGSPEVRSMVHHYIKMLQWTLHYYYHGIVSWSYFYPYHYAPMLSDVRDLESLDLRFDMGKPLLPFQQLMGVLPAFSRDLLPAAYQDLLTDPNSPVIDLYPHEFKTDLNGKRQAYESVVLIPFIEEKRLLAAMKSRDHLLTRDEKHRNRFNETLAFIYSPKSLPVYPSPDPEHFPDVTANHCKVARFHGPSLSDSVTLRFGLCEGARTGNRLQPGFPSLFQLPHHWKAEKARVMISNLKSHRESMVIYLNDSPLEKNPNVAEVAGQLLDRVVLVDWPYLREAKVVSVHDGDTVYVRDPRGRVVAQTLSGADAAVVREKVRDNLAFMETRGLRVKKPRLTVGVLRLRSMKEDDQGWLRKEYDPVDAIDFVPLKAVIHQPRGKDTRFVERPFFARDRRLPADTAVFFLAPAFYGQPGTVAANAPANPAEVSLKMRVYRAHTDAGYRAFGDRQRNLGHAFTAREAYHDVMDVVDALHVPYHVLSRLCTSFSLFLADDTEVDVGLGFRSPDGERSALGYARQVDDLWRYSTRAINLIRLYQATCPRLFRWLAKNPQAGEAEAADVFGEKAEGGEVTALVDFVRGLHLDRLVYAVADADSLLPESVTSLEHGVDALLREHGADYLSEDQTKEIGISSVPRQAVLEPSEAPTRLADQTFVLGDCVRNLTPNLAVPFAACGYVVLLTPTHVGVLFDVPFPAGTNLGGLCSAGRGYQLDRKHLLNLSNPQYVRGATSSAPAAQPGNAAANAHASTPLTTPQAPTDGPSAAKPAGRSSGRTSRKPKGKPATVLADPAPAAQVPATPLPTAPQPAAQPSGAAGSSAPSKPRRQRAPKAAKVPTATSADAPSTNPASAGPIAAPKPTDNIVNSLLSQMKGLKVDSPKSSTGADSPTANKSKVNEANEVLARALLGSLKGGKVPPPKDS
ncbi:exonuclease II Exo2 [Tieghemiomyces parasiticus]|uniref:5'-3' exoribonuclease 1 n=1 Tax=Tieghemiomyces parasiticus TaxID=78921 RepID=A0A9W8DSU9_9FUNG|nr:exonuclease II Exo2 [Tieghemiomyces parasiticus]